MRVRKRMFNSQAPQMASYHKGPILTNGVLEFVYEKPVTWPLYTFLGGGVATNQQFNPYQGPQLDYDLALTTAPIYGAGVPASQIDYQNLVAQQAGGTVTSD
jgi:hypothetical protein